MTSRSTSIRVLTDVVDQRAAAQLINDTWAAPLVLPNMARAIQQAGGYVAGAFEDGRLVGASVAFLGRARGQSTLHSHVTAVVDPHAGLGFRLKMHQREWCAERAITAVTWTFDPLVARNGYFNLHKLGAVCDAYLPNHYGEMADDVNAGEETDRFHVWWPIAPQPSPPTAGLDNDPVMLLDSAQGDEPELRDVDLLAAGAGPLAVRVPPDVEQIRRHDKALAQRWRAASRTAFLRAYDAGYRATDMRRDGTYLLTRMTP